MADGSTKRPMGRPSRYQEIVGDRLDEVCGLARSGMTRPEIAAAFGVALRTWDAWIAKHDDFRQALKLGKRIVDYRVENAFLSRCLGFEYDEVQTVSLTTPQEIAKAIRFGLQPQTVVLRVTRTRKRVIPHVTACLAWMNNRMPDKWRAEGGEDENQDAAALAHRLLAFRDAARATVGAADRPLDRDVGPPDAAGALAEPPALSSGSGGETVGED